MVPAWLRTPILKQILKNPQGVHGYEPFQSAADPVSLPRISHIRRIFSKSSCWMLIKSVASIVGSSYLSQIDNRGGCKCKFMKQSTSKRIINMDYKHNARIIQTRSNGMAQQQQEQQQMLHKGCYARQDLYTSSHYPTTSYDSGLFDHLWCVM